MIQFRMYFDKDKETRWLNEMAQKGWAMTKFFAGFYTFEPCEKGEYLYQIDFGDRLFAVNDSYREFMEEMDVEILQPWGFWIILRKKASQGNFVLYTDVDSSIEHYTKILKMFKIVTIIELLCFLLEVFGAINGVTVGVFGMLIIGILIIALMRATLSTKRLINELKERKGEPVPSGFATGNISPVLISGLLLNVCATTLTHSSVSHTIVMTTQIVAIVAMLVGLYHSRNVFKK